MRDLVITPPAEIRTLENASEAFTAATRRIKTLGETLEREFVALARAQDVLAVEGLEVNATFADPVQAAYRAWSGDRLALVTPRVLR